MQDSMLIVIIIILNNLYIHIYISVIIIIITIGFKKDHYNKSFYKSFGPGSPYDNIGPQQYIEGTINNISYPINGPWRNRTILRYCDVIENNNTILNDDWPDPDIFARIVPIVTKWAGKH